MCCDSLRKDRMLLAVANVYTVVLLYYQRIRKYQLQPYNAKNMEKRVNQRSNGMIVLHLPMGCRIEQSLIFLSINEERSINNYYCMFQLLSTQ